ncbi:MAG: MCE family protein [Planctomycetes bacterium]|nr:MCE family protein [Planctomycetota bacterium]
MDWRLRKFELWVGGLAGGAIGLLIVVFVVKGGPSQLFSDNVNAFMFMSRSHNLRQGAPVKMLDFNVGTVKEVSLQDDLKVRVVMQFRKKHLKFIRTNSAAMLRSTVIGESFIEIKPGDADSPEISEMDELRFEPFKDAVAEITDSAKNLVDSLNNQDHTVGKMLNDKGAFYNSILTTLRNVESLTGETTLNLLKNVERLTGQLNTTLQNVNSPKGTVGALLSDRELYDKILRMQDQSAELLQQTKIMFERLNSMLLDLNKTTAQLPELTRYGTETAASGREVVDGLKRVWPISSAFSQPTEDELLGINPICGQ